MKECLQVLAPHLVLTGCIEVMKTALSSGYPVVALASKRSAGNTWTIESMPTGGILHTCVLAVATSGMLHHKSKVTL